MDLSVSPGQQGLHSCTGVDDETFVARIYSEAYRWKFGNRIARVRSS